MRNPAGSFPHALRASFLLLLPLAVACGGDSGSQGETCGNGLCSADESRESCPRDCTSDCVPGQQRCDGNVLLVCEADGLTERAFPCQPGQFCDPGLGCQESPGPGPDLGIPDVDDDATDAIAEADLEDLAEDPLDADAAVDVAEDPADQGDTGDAEGTGDVLEDPVDVPGDADGTGDTSSDVLDEGTGS